MTKLTKRVIEALKADQTDFIAWDDDVPGFGIRVFASGKRSYLIQYRAKGRTRRLTLGLHGVLTPYQARALAVQKLADVRRGGDPSEDRDIDRKSMTVNELCDLYLKDGCKMKKATTMVADRGRIERHIRPLLGVRRVKDLSRQDVVQFMHQVADGKTAVDVKTKKHGRAIVQGGSGTATRTVGLLGGILTFAVERGIIAASPSRGIKRFKDNKSQRFMSAAELANLGEALRQAELEGENVSAIAAIRLLILTGARKGEILSAKWDYVDFERGYLRLPDSKTGAKDIPLGAPALQLLTELHRAGSGPYVVVGTNPKKPFVGLPKAWLRIRKLAGLENFRLHDLRHSFVSVGVASGDSLYVIGKVVGHANAATTQRYAHLSDNPIKNAADRISGRIAAGLEPVADEVKSNIQAIR